MAAGQGFKTFTTGEVLTAGDVNGYLMQGVLVFASTAARDAAITSPQEGQFAYLKDTNVTTYYTGSAWANVDSTGMTNPMTTTGDTIYSSSGSTPARLGIGSTGNVLTVAGGVPTWAAPAGGGGKVLQVVSGTYSTQTTAATSATFGDSGLSLSITPTLSTSKILVIVAQPLWTTMLSGSNTEVRVKIKLVRDSTDIYTSTTAVTVGGASSASIAAGSNISVVYLDSPATTSATTYKTQGAAAFDSNEIAQFQRNGATATITLLEIGA
jgi:hypothetical protein